MNLKLKTLSVVVTLFLYSLAVGQTRPAQPKDGDLKFEPFTIPFEDGMSQASWDGLSSKRTAATPKRT